MREFVRHPSDIPIEYNIGDMVTHTKEYLKDISQGGLCFRSNIGAIPGSTVHIQIPICNPIFQADGVVVWCNRVDDYYEVGLSFNDTQTEFSIRMVEQVCHIEQYKKDILEKEGRTLTGEEAAVEWIKKNAADFLQ